MRAWGAIAALWACLPACLAQGQPQVLGYAAFEQRVLQNHPLARQASLYADIGRAQLREARGAFDPKLAFYSSEKVFGNTFYYRDQGLKATVPIRAGINLAGGYERVIGTYADPQVKTPLAGLYYGGVEVSLGRGLFIDSRRAGVLQGRNLQTLGQVQALNYGNKLILNAAKDYWDWWNAWTTTGYLQTGVSLALARLNAVRTQVAIGEEAAIDTVEALILYQDRYTQFLTAQQARRAAYLRLQTYFWQERFEPLQLDTAVQPEATLPSPASPIMPDDAVAESINRQNPSLRMQRTELAQLDIDRRLAAEMLKPEVDLKYQLLGGDGNLPAEATRQYARGNYRFGAQVGMPILLRKERGKLQQTKLKLQQAQLALRQAERDLEADTRTTLAELRTLARQVQVQQSMATNYARLREGETLKFGLGESSLFLVNTRESKLLEAQVKLADLQAKYQKAVAALRYLAGGTLPWQSQ